jgi:hypothetical protein
VTLQRLVITFKPEELVLHALYRTPYGPNPVTKALTTSVAELAGSGLRYALVHTQRG